MGINYYIYLTIPSKDTTFSTEVCHIGKSQIYGYLDFISLYDFFSGFDTDLHKISEIKEKLEDDTLTEADSLGFQALLIDFYETHVSDSFECRDEYGNVMSFREIIVALSRNGFEKYKTNSYMIDGLCIDQNTGFF